MMGLSGLTELKINANASDKLAASSPLSKPANHAEKFSEVHAGEFESENHFYPRVLNAQIHPTVQTFLNLGLERLIKRYCHMNPRVTFDTLRSILQYRPAHFHWAGSDLFNVATSEGKRCMIIIETNSCPSGQKSMPIKSDTEEMGGYAFVINKTFKYLLKKADPRLGGLAVVYDKNYMEASGYAAAIAEAMEETVYLVEFSCKDDDPPVRFTDDRIMEIRDPATGEWKSIRAAFRYVTQKPWKLFPIKTRTIVLNEIVSCIAGGRNKLTAAKAYKDFNDSMKGTGLEIRTPETFWDVKKEEIPGIVESMGGHAVIKIPYSNAGQGVFTITKMSELDSFMELEHGYDAFIVQSLVGNSNWSSIQGKTNKFYHVGTIPNAKCHTYVADIRMMVCGCDSGFQPVAVYARKARKPLIEDLENNPYDYSTWDMLGTNLSVKDGNGNWTTAPERLMLMDRKDFNQLGISMDDLIDAYLQTVMSIIAIDKLATKLLSEDGIFDLELFKALNPDDSLISEFYDQLEKNKK